MDDNPEAAATVSKVRTHRHRGCVSDGAPVVGPALLATLLGLAVAAHAGPTGTSVQCVFADGRVHSFGPGRDRCWDPINGRTLVPRTVLACSVPREGDPAPQIIFLFSEHEQPACERGRRASAAEIQSTLQQLGAQERAMVVATLPH
jgi:hypothetical protein